MIGWSAVHAAVKDRCEAGGLDIVHPFSSAERRFAILIGNTKRLWPIFLAQADQSARNPLDDHVVCVVSDALAPYEHTVRWAHVPPYVPIQRIAEEAGLARLSLTHLAIHPEYGPWFALRAVAVFDLEGPAPATSADRCEGCEVRCRAALDAATGSGDWKKWLAVRDACSVGREWRYSDEQIEYHYTKVKRW